MKKPSAFAAGAVSPAAEGWSVVTVVRAGGATKGRPDKYYISPDGRKFRTFKGANQLAILSNDLAMLSSDVSLSSHNIITPL